MFLVYKVTFPNNKVYIGITSRKLSIRRSEHYSKSRNLKFAFYNALNKYKSLELWEEIYNTNDYEDVLKREQYFIRFYKTNIKTFGYNLTDGGEGALGYKASKQTRLKLSRLAKNRKCTKETREKLSKLKLGKKYPKQFGDRLSLSQGSKVFQVFNKISGVLIWEGFNKNTCAKELNLKRRKIQDCLQNKRKSTGDCIFLYKEVQYRKTK